MLDMKNITHRRLFGLSLVVAFSILTIGGSLMLLEINQDVPLVEKKILNEGFAPRSSLDPTSVGLWDFEGSTGNAVPSKPSITLYGSSSIQISGGVNNSGYLHLAAASNTYAEIPYDTSYDGTGLSFEFWMKSTGDYIDNQDIIRKKDNNYWVFRNLWNQYNDGPVKASFQRTGGLYTTATNTNDLSHWKWHHIAVVLGSNSIGYYLNGEHIWTASSTEGPKTGVANITLGDPNEPVELHLDHLQFYNKMLSSNDVLNIYSKTRPIANFNANTTAPIEGQTVSFDASSTYGGEPSTYTYNWNFGDGTILYDGGVNPHHTYSTAGSYKVELNVSDYYGVSNPKALWINVQEPDDPFEENDNYNCPYYLDIHTITTYNNLRLFDEDNYEFTANANEEVVVNLHTTEYIGNIILNDINPNDGSLIRTDSGGGDQLLTLIFRAKPTQQNYVIKVNQTTFGLSYDLTFSYYPATPEDQAEENDDIESAHYVQMEISLENMVQYDDDWYSFYNPVSIMYIKMSCSSASPFQIEIYDRNGDLLSNVSMSSADEELYFTSDYGKADDYYIRVTGDNTGAMYSLYVQSTPFEQTVTSTNTTTNENDAGGGTQGSPFEVDGFPLSYGILMGAIAVLFLLFKKRKNIAANM